MISVTLTSPDKAIPCSIYKPYYMSLFINAIDSLMTFIILDSTLMLQPTLFSMLKEIRFLSSSYTCLTLDSSLIMPLYILSPIELILVTLQDVLFPNITLPLSYD